MEETRLAFEDYGTFYANQKMVGADLVLSMGSGIIYEISDAKDVVLVSLISPYSDFTEQAKQDIENDSAAWYGIACVTTGAGNKLIWEY
ncbi:MAG: hypothetical protein ABII98_01620 [bacterium]